MSVLLGRAELSMFADPAVNVEIPALMAAPRRRGTNGVLVGPFEGDTYPTAFRGEGRTGTFDFTCRYSLKQAEQRVRLEWLVDKYAPAQFDHRLLLRTHLEPGTDLPAELQEFLAEGAAVAVEVFDLVSTPIAGRNWDLTFTASIVEHDFAVTPDGT